MPIRLAVNFTVVAFALCAGVFSAPAAWGQASENAAQQAPVSATQRPQVEAGPVPDALETGFHRLYELRFEDARGEFAAYQKDHPEDPMGKAAEAASYLFEQFHAKGVLTSEFFLDDEKFLGGVDGSASENRNDAFVRTNNQARDLAKQRLKSNPRDIPSLLALTLADGMESDYDAMIIKKQLAGLKMTRRAEEDAHALLAADSNQKDADVALGMSNYVISYLPGFKRALIWFGGFHGDRMLGIQQMASAAEHGHFLQPYAKVMLALAYEREHQPELARPLLQDLTVQYPANTIFAHELALLDLQNAAHVDRGPPH
jgi:hypothetical protein